MTKDKTVTLSRELAKCLASPHQVVRDEAVHVLRSLLAAPAAERQMPNQCAEPIDDHHRKNGVLYVTGLPLAAYCTPVVGRREPASVIRCSFCDVTDKDGNPWTGGHSTKDGVLAYRVIGCKNHKHLVDACLDKVKELNQ